jgi:hypothetical protein
MFVKSSKVSKCKQGVHRERDSSGACAVHLVTVTCGSGLFRGHLNLIFNRNNRVNFKEGLQLNSASPPASKGNDDDDVSVETNSAMAPCSSANH